MLFDKTHILFMIIGFLSVAGLLVLAGVFIKQNKFKGLVLKTAAIATVILHYSTLWVDYLQTGAAEVGGGMLFLIYPCHIAMWLLVVAAFIKNKNGKVFKIVAEFVFYLGIIGGIIGIVLNEIYASTPNLKEWDVLNGMLSHLTLLFGCTYLLVGKFIKIRVSNLISVACGLMFLFLDGLFVIGIFQHFKLDPPNAMYLLENPVPRLAWFNTYIIGLIALLLVFAITGIYELIALKKEDRWYHKLKKKEKKDERVSN